MSNKTTGRSLDHGRVLEDKVAIVTGAGRGIGAPDEVAATGVWLCSDQPSFITGAVIPVDGGRLAGGA
jgi:NAD(P)-dependent dehydrogenase (short-subunit alcohol dehydrogenase family)